MVLADLVGDGDPVPFPIPHSSFPIHLVQAAQAEAIQASGCFDLAQHRLDDRLAQGVDRLAGLGADLAVHPVSRTCDQHGRQLAGVGHDPLHHGQEMGGLTGLQDRAVPTSEDGAVRAVAPGLARRVGGQGAAEHHRGISAGFQRWLPVPGPAALALALHSSAASSACSCASAYCFAEALRARAIAPEPRLLA